MNLPSLAPGEIQAISNSAASRFPLVGSETTPTRGEILPSRVSIWLVSLWLVGVAGFGLRAAGGFWWLERLRRQDSEPVSPRLRETCRSLQKRFGITRLVRYRTCAWLDAPAVIGWFRPIVFVPMTALTGLSETQLRLVLAHELAHIRRWDAAFNLVQIASEMLLFFNPAVWWLNRRIRIEREHCCDDRAVSLCQAPLEYARALALMAQWRAAPTLAMAANHGPVVQRVARLLGASPRGVRDRASATAAGVLCVTAALLAGTVFAQASTTRNEAMPRNEDTPIDELSVRASSPTSASSTAAWWGEGWKALSEGQKAALEVHGITHSYLQEMRDEGLSPSFDELVAFRVHGVTREYVRDIRTHVTGVDENSLIAMRVHGITASFVTGLQARGLEVDSDQVIALTVHGITPDLVWRFQEAGLEVDSDQIIGMQVNGVTPSYVSGAVELGLQPKSDSIIGLQIHDITLDDLKYLEERGFPMKADRLIALKKQGRLPDSS